jgi:hypothetical protein
MFLGNNIPYKVYNKFDVLPIAKRLVELGNDVWNFNTFRQVEVHNNPHINTKSLILNYCPGEPEVDRYVSDKHFNTAILTYENFLEDIKKIKKIDIDQELNLLTDAIVTKLEQKFNGIAGNVIYAKLSAGKTITAHIDPGYYLSVVHRLHIPIITNEKVIFKTRGSAVNMIQGFLYEINNCILHSVENNGTEDRVHLIVDIIPKDKLI